MNTFYPLVNEKLNTVLSKNTFYFYNEEFEGIRISKYQIIEVEIL